MRKLHSELDEFSQILEESTDTDRALNRLDYGMSGRDNDITAMAIQGLTIREIAEQLGLAEITVKKHLATIYRKLGVNRKSELVGKFKELL